jgi:hypothetical protein
MDDGEIFRAQAEQCRILAARQRNARDRATLLHLAAQWDQLTEEHELDLVPKERKQT